MTVPCHLLLPRLLVVLLVLGLAQANWILHGHEDVEVKKIP